MKNIVAVTIIFSESKKVVDLTMNVLLPVFAALIFVSVVLTSSKGELFYLSLSK